MYFQASPSTSQLTAANGARTSTNAIADTAVAASVSLERRSSRFQTACSVAAPSASASAESATYPLFEPDEEIVVSQRRRIHRRHRARVPVQVERPDTDVVVPRAVVRRRVTGPPDVDGRERVVRSAEVRSVDDRVLGSERELEAIDARGGVLDVRVGDVLRLRRDGRAAGADRRERDRCAARALSACGAGQALGSLRSLRALEELERRGGDLLRRHGLVL